MLDQPLLSVLPGDEATIKIGQEESPQWVFRASTEHQICRKWSMCIRQCQLELVFVWTWWLALLARMLRVVHLWHTRHDLLK
jgi:hypothetical protein